MIGIDYSIEVAALDMTTLDRFHCMYFHSEVS